MGSEKSDCRVTYTRTFVVSILSTIHLSAYLFQPTCISLQVEWDEKWWEASDWAGMRELGAEKSGCII